MKAMILAAGLGKRMRPLTDKLPKPLLPLAGKPLIVYHLERLRAQGIVEFVINVAYLGEMIQAALGDGSSLGVSIRYSDEVEPLETGGAILQALPLLGDTPFLLVNADVWTDYPFQQLILSPLDEGCLGRLVLVPNPAHNHHGDFALEGECLLSASARDAGGLTFSGLSLLRPQLVDQYARRRPCFPLREVFDDAIAQGRLCGELYNGQWWDIGTPERLQALDRSLCRSGC